MAPLASPARSLGEEEETEEGQESAPPSPLPRINLLLPGWESGRAPQTGQWTERPGLWEDMRTHRAQRVSTLLVAELAWLGMASGQSANPDFVNFGLNLCDHIDVSVSW